MNRLRTLASVRQQGFTIVELMVGMAIGLFVVLIIVQVMSFFDAQNRTTRGAAEAQTNGSIALYSIVRELQMAGYPLLASATDSPLNCTTAGMVATLTPVSITEGVATLTTNASDTLTLRYGTGGAGGVPSVIGAVSGMNVVLATNFGCQSGDVALISNGASCAQTSVTGISGTTTVTLASVTGAVVGGAVACLGPVWNTVSYSVDGTGNLVRTLNGVAAPILSGIVNLQAQYGVSATAQSNVVTQWVNATGGTWASPTVADRNRIKAVRIAVVSRDDKTELSDVSRACVANSPDAAKDPTKSVANGLSGVCAWEGSDASPAPAIDLSPADANWRRARYRTFETIVPLRNVIWSKDAL